MFPRQPQPAHGRYGIASEFGSLDGWSLEEAVEYLSNHPALKRTPSPQLAIVISYLFEDDSEVWIRPTGQIIRLPHRIYGSDGRRIAWYRINIYTGELVTVEAWHNLPRDEQEWVVNE